MPSLNENIPLNAQEFILHTVTTVLPYLITRTLTSMGYALGLSIQLKRDLDLLRSAGHLTLMNSMGGIIREVNGQGSVDMASAFVDWQQTPNDPDVINTLIQKIQAAANVALQTGFFSLLVNQFYCEFILENIESNPSVINQIKYYPLMSAINWPLVNLGINMGSTAFATGDKRILSIAYTCSGITVVSMSSLMERMSVSPLLSIIISNICQFLGFNTILLGYWYHHSSEKNKDQLRHAPLVFEALFNRNILSLEVFKQACRIMGHGSQRSLVLFMQMMPVLLTPYLLRSDNHSLVYFSVLPYFFSLITVCNTFEQIMSIYVRATYQKYTGDPQVQATQVKRCLIHSGSILLPIEFLVILSCFLPGAIDFVGGNKMPSTLKPMLSIYLPTVISIILPMYGASLMRSSIVAFRGTNINKYDQYNQLSTVTSVGLGIGNLIGSALSYFYTNTIMSFAVTGLFFAFMNMALQTLLAVKNFSVIRSGSDTQAILPPPAINTGANLRTLTFFGGSADARHEEINLDPSVATGITQPNG